MGWEHDRYEAVWEECGHRGIVVESSDSWGRFARRYEGFGNVDPSPTAIGRRRSDARQSSPLCDCGSSAVTRGMRLD